MRLDVEVVMEEHMSAAVSWGYFPVAGCGLLLLQSKGSGCTDFSNSGEQA